MPHHNNDFGKIASLSTAVSRINAVFAEFSVLPTRRHEIAQR